MAAAALAFQLYSARDALARGPDAVAAELAALADIGFTHVEPFDGLYDDLDALAAAVEASGLAVASGHFGLALAEGDVERSVAVAGRLGMRFVVMPYLAPKDRPTDRAGWDLLAGRLRRLSERYAAEDLVLAYHNHDFEFHALPDGTMPIEHLLDTGLRWEADLAWVIRAGQDPEGWLARYRGQVPLVHIKDIAPEGENRDEDGWADVGAGTVDWPRLWAACRDAGAEVMVAEHDRPSDPRRFARASFDAMARLDRGAA